MKSHLLIIFTILNSCASISKNTIHEIFPKTESKNCYICDDNCASPAVTSCDSANKCYSKSTRNSDNTTIETKGCIEPDLASSLCGNPNGDVVSCYTCDDSYCNGSPRNENGVTRCYVCIDECSTPPDQHICEEVLDSVQGVPVKAACLSYEIRNEGQVTESKGCIADDPIIRQACVLANLIYEEITCSICDEDLCNHEIEEEPSVEQCYYCMDNCDVHQEIQNCRDELGENVTSKCGAIDYVLGGERIVARGCLEVTDSIQSMCNLVNILGGNCTICDTNLCNGGEISEPEDYVDECYYCEGTCEGPLEVQQCENDKSKCIVTEIAQDGETLVTRGCIEVTDEVQSNCDYINQQGGNCTICDTNLCNGIDEVQEPSVEQCYYCMDNCDVHQEIQNCKDELGEDVISKCGAIDYVFGGERIVARGCIEVTNSIQNTCNLINILGGNCTICDTNLCNGGDIPEPGDYADECYYCEGTCEDPLEVQQCENDRSKCIVTEITQNGVTSVSRGCVEVTDEVQSNCDSINQQGGNCTICDTNLCNGIEVIEIYVDECYFCRDTCEGPLEIQQCQNDKSKCIATEITQNGVTSVSRGCVEVTDEVQSNCDSINQQGGNCTICDTNLCNGIHEVENSVDECYYCQNTCNPPLEIHQCKEILGEDVTSKCIAIEVVVDGETLMSRGCVEVTDLIQSTCNTVNEEGGNCTICDTNLCNGMEVKDDGSSSEKVVSLIYVVLFSTFLIKFA